MLPIRLINILNSQTFNNAQIVDSFITELYDSIPLYINCTSVINSLIPLYLNSGGYNGSMNLFLHAGNWNNSTADLMTVIHGTPAGVSGQKNVSLDLFVNGGASSGNLTSEFPLYVLADNAIETNSSMKLYLQTLGNLDGSITVGGGITAFLKNGYEGISSGIPLFLAGPAGTSGAVPIEDSMNLYIARDSECLAGSTPLYINGPAVSPSETPLFIEGQQVGTGSITGYIYGIETEEGNITVFTRGF